MRRIYNIFWSLVALAIIIYEAWQHNSFWTAVFAVTLIFNAGYLIVLFAKGTVVNINIIKPKDK